ncbi:MAG: DNA repair protein, partial [Aeromonas veronii]
MILTLVLLSIGALLFLVIAYNVVQQYKQKAEADKRHAVARHKTVADETEEVLLNVNLVPFSKNMVLLLQHRILDAYRAIAQVMP